ncbi:MAG: hypothetical protein R2716_02750 [Microthrixaceae bacterium]
MRRVGLAPDPARFDEAGRFREAVFTATREVAIVALRGSAPQLQPARGIVDATLADPDSLRPSLAEWLGELDEGLAALRSAAVSWVIDARALARVVAPRTGTSPGRSPTRPARSG